MNDDELYGLLTSAAENLRSADKDERRVEAAFRIAFKLEAYCKELSARATADHSAREAFEAWAMDFYGCDRVHVDHFAGVDGYVIWQASPGDDGRFEKLQASIDALEQLRPVWAMTEAEPQVVAAALSSVWKLLGAAHQTDAMQKLHVLITEQHGKTQQIDALLAHCPDGECSTCAEIICPHKSDMHFHHDGCPACAEHDASA